MIAPFANACLSSISIDANRKTTITRSDTFNVTARTIGSGVTLPAVLMIPNSSVIWPEVQYAYKPTVGYIITGTSTFKDQLY